MHFDVYISCIEPFIVYSFFSIVLLQLSIGNFPAVFQPGQVLALPPMSEPEGKGRAYQKFLDIYNEMHEDTE